MTGLSDLGIVVRSLRTRTFSTATTALTVGVAVALLLTLLSLRAAGQRAFDRGSGNAHLLVSADASPIASVLNALFYANAPQRALARAWPARAARASQLETVVRGACGDAVDVRTHASPAQALADALARADPADRILVFGSFYTVGGVLERGLPRTAAPHAP